MNFTDVSASTVPTLSVPADVVSIVDSGCTHCIGVMAVFVDVDDCGSSRVE